MKHISGQKRKGFAQERFKEKWKIQQGIRQIAFSSIHNVLGSEDLLVFLLWPRSWGQLSWRLALCSEDVLLRAMGSLRSVKWSWWGFTSWQLQSERTNSRKISEITNKSARVVIVRVLHISVQLMFSVSVLVLPKGPSLGWVSKTVPDALGCACYTDEPPCSTTDIRTCCSCLLPELP